MIYYSKSTQFFSQFFFHRKFHQKAVNLWDISANVNHILRLFGTHFTNFIKKALTYYLL